MADTDIFGILSLLLFLGGAAYLVRARVLSKNARLEPPHDPVVSEPPDSVRTQRTRETVPPKILRAGGDAAAGPPKSAAAKAPVAKPVAAKPVPAATVKAPDTRTGEADEPAPNTKPSERSLPRGAASGPESVPPASGNRSPSIGAKTLTFGSIPPTELGAQAPFAPKDTLASKASANTGAAEGVDSSKPPTTKPAATPKPASTRTPAAPAPTQGAKVAEGKAAGAKAPPSDALPRLDDALPRIDVEDDEDVEPTKVGKVETRREIQPSVERIVFDTDADLAPPDKVAAVGIVAYAQTDPGKRRKQNEDSFLVLDKHALYVVADGMGGHRGGQHASKLAVSTMKDAFEANRFEAAPHPNLALRASELARSMQMANSAIFEESKRTRELKGMGTTLCAACFDSTRRRMYIGHVGDSRCYRVRGGVMKQITTDHTMADYGVTGPEGSHLSRALGVWPTVPIDIIMVEPQVGDLYMVCSDGLTKMLPNETIATQLLHEDDPKAAIERLVFFANAHGGKDNITVILLRIVAADDKKPVAR